MIKLTGICCGVFIFMVQSISGQNMFSSPYSVYGIGFINERTSTFNRAMAGTGIAVQDEFNLNNVNPASYGAISSPISHIYEMGFYLESNRYQTVSLSESKTNGGLNNLNYWFKFSPRWAATLGLSPFSSVSYNISTEKETGAGVPVTYNYNGSGNITQLYLGNSINLIKNLSLGVNASFLFGSIKKNEAIESGSLVNNLTLENKISANKFDFDIGLQYKIKLKDRVLIIGAIADDGLSLRGKQEATLIDASSDTLSSTEGKRLTYKLPASFGAGLSLQSSRSIIATDLRYKKWTDASFENEDVTFKDIWKFSFGYAYKGNPNAENYLGLISLRTGFYVQDYYLKLEGNTMPNWGVSAGISLPVFDNKSSVNLTYSFDQIGTTQDGLVLQRSQKIMFDLVIRDLWGIRRKFD